MKPVKSVTKSKTTKRVGIAAAVSMPVATALTSFLFDLVGWNLGPEVETAVTSLVAAVFTALGSRWIAKWKAGNE